MSSREIAQLCEKRHDHVLRDVDNLNSTYEKMGLPKVGEGSYTTPNTGNQHYREFLLTKEQTIDLITGYRADVRIRINRRWQELENQQPKLPSNYIEALESLIESEKQKQVLQLELKNAQPKINHYDKVVERQNLVNATQVGAKLGGMSAIKLNKHLTELGVYNQSVKRGKVFNTWFEQKGYGEMKQTELGFDQPLFTQKGQAWIIEQLTVEGVA